MLRRKLEVSLQMMLVYPNYHDLSGSAGPGISSGLAI